jgi:hypothetical protein
VDWSATVTVNAGPAYERSVLDESNTGRRYDLTDYAVHLWRQTSGRAQSLPPKNGADDAEDAGTGTDRP